MNRILEWVFSRKQDTLLAIEWAIATMTALGGLYIYSPLYDISATVGGSSIFVAALANPPLITLWGAVLLIGAIVVLVGLWKKSPRIKSAGWFMVILARVFQLLTLFLVQGFFPTSWLYPLTLTLIIIILWGHNRVQIGKQ